MSEQHKWWDVWQAGEDHWQAQMINYVANFTTQEQADRFVAATIKYRTDKGLKI